MTRLTVIRLLAFTTAIGAMTTQAGAQSLGAKGGINLSTIHVSPSGELGELGSLPGGTFGGYVTFKETSRLSFEVNGFWSIRRISFGPLITDTLTYVEAPVIARYPVMSREGLVARVTGGVVPAFRISASESVSGESYSVKDAYKAFDLAVVVGGQAEFKNKWTIDVRYLFGVSDVYEVTIGSERTRQWGLQALVGYRLR